MNCDRAGDFGAERRRAHPAGFPGEQICAVPVFEHSKMVRDSGLRHTQRAGCSTQGARFVHREEGSQKVQGRPLSGHQQLIPDGQRSPQIVVTCVVDNLGEVLVAVFRAWLA